MAPPESAPLEAPAHPVNNFDLLRLFAALLVFWFHALALTGRSAPLLFSWIPPGPLGVIIFFLISGYLVSKSWESDPHAVRFLARRALRIFPALTVLVVLTAVVLGPALTTMPLHAYLHHPLFRGYFNNIRLLSRYALPGVFEHQIYPFAVNGSLWSLPVEFTFYLTLMLLGLARTPRWVIAALALICCWATLRWPLSRENLIVVYGMSMQDMVMYGVYFLLGVCVSRFRLERHLTLTGLCAGIVLMIAVEPWPMASRIVSWIAFPAIFLTFGLATSAAARALAGLGDYSYGVYIYAFPVQQSVLYLYPSLPMAAYVGLSMAITFALAAASWHWIERRALAFKPRKRDRAAQVQQ